MSRGEMSWGGTSRGRTDEGAKRPLTEQQPDIEFLTRLHLPVSQALPKHRRNWTDLYRQTII